MIISWLGSGFNLGFGFGLSSCRRWLRGLPALRTFLGFADDDIIAFRAGDGTFDEQQVVRFAHLDDLQILGGAA